MLIGVSVLVFSLVHLVHGDPVRLSRWARGSRRDLRRTAAPQRTGPAAACEQYFTWAGRALTGDLGVSFRSGEPVAGRSADRLPATLIAGVSRRSCVALLVAIPLGMLSAACTSGSLIDRVATVISQIGISVPDFWLAIVLILVFAGTLGWLPPAGYVPLFEDPRGLAAT